MFNRITALLAGGGRNAEPAAAPRADDKHLAAAVLMVEAARLDGHFDEAEKQVIEGIVQRHFGLDSDETGALLAAAMETHDQVHQLVGFTRTIKDAYSAPERIALIEMLWEVAYADGELHHFEANLLRRIAGLLYVSDRDSGLARKRVLTRHEGGASDT
jgi:uncharacterized tellurite resistance protein B-like protein